MDIFLILISLAVSGIICYFTDRENIKAPILWGIGIVAGFIIGLLFAKSLFIPKEYNNKSKYIYQVRELEKNTVFNITDSIGGFQTKDSVWVNMSKLMVDPLDSVAMQCVIIKEIK